MTIAILALEILFIWSKSLFWPKISHNYIIRPLKYILTTNSNTHYLGACYFCCRKIQGETLRNRVKGIVDTVGWERGLNNSSTSALELKARIQKEYVTFVINIAILRPFLTLPLWLEIFITCKSEGSGWVSRHDNFKYHRTKGEDVRKSPSLTDTLWEWALILQIVSADT